MIIHIASLKEGKPESISEELDAKEIDVEFTDLHYVGKISILGTVEKNLTIVTFKGTITRSVEHTCARCLKEVNERLSDTVEYNYDSHGVDEISTLDDIRDDLILSHPEQYLCKEDCRGLCQNCGVDLNVTKCNCRKERSKNPFLKLQKFKRTTNDEK